MPVVACPPDNSSNGIKLSPDGLGPPEAGSEAQRLPVTQAGHPKPAGQPAAAASQQQAPVVLIARPLPRVLLVHCGGTLGMDAAASFELDLEGHTQLKPVSGSTPSSERGCWCQHAKPP